MQTEIRLVEASDYVAWAALWQEYLTFYETSRPQSVYQESWARILDTDHKMHSALAFQNNQPVGLVNFLYHPTFWSIGDSCYLNDLFVDPAARGTGLGAKLIAFTRKHADDQGVEQVYWMTAQDNARARALYDRVARATPFMKYACP